MRAWAGVAATVDGVPVSLDEVDAREASLRGSRIASALPRPGTSEGRQLRRWLTQLLVAERVVAAEAAARGLTTDGAPAEAEVLPDTTVRMEIGSVAASVLGEPLARAVFAQLTADVDVGDDEVASYRRRNPLRFDTREEVAEHLRAAARRRAFRLWLDARCANVVELAPGYEHPGDPRQPDNTHRH
nr:malonyl CoA-ACP transacylase [Mycolicibacterium malmesburyense]CRL68043.1 malonyl CoA-acyl carrier protein transacylase, FabD2 [Mycolicibacterium malmesburyense]